MTRASAAAISSCGGCYWAHLVGDVEEWHVILLLRHSSGESRQLQAPAHQAKPNQASHRQGSQISRVLLLSALQRAVSQPVLLCFGTAA